jgi:hypothetical protein
VETYAPVPDELLHVAPQSLRRLGTILKVAVLIGAAALLLHLMYPTEPPDFRNFGVVNTSLGTAIVACGGEVASDPGCGGQTALVFDSCPAMERTFPYHWDDPAKTDAAVRALIGKRPPSGSRWTVACGHDGLANRHLADLKPI